MKFLFLFFGVLLMAIPAGAQRRLRSRLPTDSTADPFPVQNISYRGAKDANGKQTLTFVLTKKSGRAPIERLSIVLDSIKLISAVDTITLYNPKADTLCIDAVNFAFHEGYCDWAFTFSLLNNQSTFLQKHEIDAVLFFERKKVRRDEFTDKRKRILMDIVKD